MLIKAKIIYDHLEFQRYPSFEEKTRLKSIQVLRCLLKAGRAQTRPHGPYMSTQQMHAHMGIVEEVLAQSKHHSN
jgi:hypothetical protein